MSQHTKAQLIELCRSRGIATGDTARNSKEHYEQLLAAAGVDVATLQPAPAAAAQPADGPDVGQVAALLAQLLATGAVNEARVREIVDAAIAERPVAERLIVVREGAPPVPVEGTVHRCFERIVRLAALRQNIYIVGPAGCGKTHVAAQVAKHLGLPFATVSCSAGMSENQLTGWLLPVEAGGRFAYVSSEFVRLYAEGGLFLLDEIDGADANVLLVLNSALANGHMTIAHRVGETRVERHRDFVCIAAANTFGHGADRVYAGRNPLDESTLDRFRAGFTEMDYDAQLEQKIVDPEVLAWGLSIREKIRALKLRRIMSTRVMLDFSKQAAAGFTREEWEAAYFAAWTRDELVKIGREG